MKIRTFLPLLLAAAVAFPVLAADISIDPYARVVEKQRKENKQWEKEAQDEEQKLARYADQYFKEKDYANAQKYFKKIVDLRYQQWIFPTPERGRQAPAREKRWERLDSAARRLAETRLEKMQETIDKETLDRLEEVADVATMKEEYVKAYKAYDDVIAAAEKMQDRRYAAVAAKKARDAQARLLLPVTKLLDEVDRLVKKGDAEGAKTKLAEVHAQYADLMALSPELSARYRSLGGAPLLEKENLEGDAARRVRLGDAAVQRKDYAQAFDYYRSTVARYEGTAAAKVAAEKLAALYADAEVIKAAQEQEAESRCKVLIARARALVRLDRLDEARACCDEVLANYPDTPWAAEAADVMQTIATSGAAKADGGEKPAEQ